MVFGKWLSNSVLVTEFTPVNYNSSVLFDEVGEVWIEARNKVVLDFGVMIVSDEE